VVTLVGGKNSRVWEVATGGRKGISFDTHTLLINLALLGSGIAFETATILGCRFSLFASFGVCSPLFTAAASPRVTLVTLTN
jgi:hypothetical protein